MEMRKQELLSVNYLLEATISRVRNLPDSAAIFGVVIDSKVFLQFLSLVLASGLSAIAKLIQFY